MSTINEHSAIKSKQLQNHSWRNAKPFLIYPPKTHRSDWFIVTSVHGYGPDWFISCVFLSFRGNGLFAFIKLTFIKVPCIPPTLK